MCPGKKTSVNKTFVYKANRAVFHGEKMQKLHFEDIEVYLSH